MSSAAVKVVDENRHPGLDAALRWINSGPKRLLIDGKWIPAQSGKTLETLNPSTEEVLTGIAEGDRADVDSAVAAARRAIPRPSGWPIPI